MYIFVSVLFMAFLQGALFVLFSHLMLTYERESKRALFLWLLPCMVSVTGNLWLMTSLATRLIFGLLFGAVWFALMFWLYEDGLGVKIRVYLIISASFLFSMKMYSLFMVLIDRRDVLAGEVSFERVGKMVLIWTMQYVLGLILLLGRQYIYQKKSIRGMVPMFLLPISQFFYMLGALKVDYIADSTYSFFLILGQVLGCGISIYWLYWLFEENRQKELEAKMKDMEKTIEKEKAHYLEIEQRRETLNSLRQGMNHQIQDVQVLLEEKKKEEAVKLLDELTELLYSTKEYTFCPVPIINAVLEEKGKECKKLGIEMEAEIQIPHNSGITEMAYCSIFSNLMDNAIRGAKEYGEAYGKAGTIRISAIYEAGFCVVKTVNPSKKPDGKLRKGHGRGTVILREIAEYYGGTYESSYKDQEYTAIVTLRK